MSQLRLRVILPLVMTGLQVGLFAAGLMIHREPWVLTPPPEARAESQPNCSGENCTATFTPVPPEPRVGILLKAAMFLNFPGVFFGGIFHVVANLLHVPHVSGEPSLIAFSLVFVPLVPR